MFSIPVTPCASRTPKNPDTAHSPSHPRAFVNSLTAPDTADRLPDQLVVNKAAVAVHAHQVFLRTHRAERVVAPGGIGVQRIAHAAVGGIEHAHRLPERARAGAGQRVAFDRSRA